MRDYKILILAIFLGLSLFPVRKSSADTLSIGGYVLTSKIRAGRTQYIYTFTAQLTNSGNTMVRNVVATLTGSVPGVMILDGELRFDRAKPGETVISQDTFAIQADLQYPDDYNNPSWSFTYTIQEVFLESLTITPASLIMTQAGDTKNLSVTGNFSDDTTHDITSGTTVTTYQSSAPDVAAVDSNGLVTAVSSGAAMITVSNDQISGTASVTVNIPPSVESFSPPHGTNTNQPSLTVTGTTNQNGLQVMVNGHTATVEGNSFSVSGLTLVEGENTITITAKNVLGLEDIKTASMFLDSIPPNLTITSPEEGSTIPYSQVSVSGEISDDNLMSHFLINNAPAHFHENRFSQMVNLSEGVNTITVSAKDEFNNETIRSITVTCIPREADQAPPELAITSPSEGQMVSSSPVQIKGRIHDESQIKGSTIDGQPVSLLTPTGSSFTASVDLVEGENTIILQATDFYDHTSTLSIKVFLDSTSPNDLQDIHIAPSSPTNADRVIISGIAEPGALVEVIGGAKFFTATASETGSFEVTVFLNENRENKLRIYARDRAGLKSPEHLASVIQDGVPPQITNLSPAAGTILPTGTVTITGEVMDNRAVNLVLINGQQVSLHESNQFSHSLTLPEGENTLTIEAEDMAGNIKTASLPLTIRLSEDHEPPLITITSPKGGSSFNQSPIQIKGTIIDASPISAVRLNGLPLDLSAALAGNVFTATVHLADNSKTLCMVEATDELGHKAEATIEIFHDSIPPGKPVPEALPPLTNHYQLTVRGQAEAGAKVIIRNGQQEVSAQVDGRGGFGQVIGLNLNVDNTISVTCLDKAGNESETAYLEIKQDSLAPQVSLVSPQDGQTELDPQPAIFVKFNESIDCASVPGNISLLANGSFLSAAFSCVDSGTSLIFQDEKINQLPSDTQFELRIEASITDLAGNELGRMYRSFFTTRDSKAPDPPVITSELPAATKYRQILINGQTEARATVTIMGGLSQIAASADDKGAFAVQVALQPNTENSLSLVAKDTSGNESEGTHLVIRHDDLPPTVTLTPSHGATDVACNTVIDITFSEPIKVNTLLSRLSLSQGEQSVEANLLWDSTFTSARYIPVNSLASQKRYTVKIAAGLSDQSDNQTNTEVLSTFTTEDTIPPESPKITSYPAKTNQTRITVSGEAEAGAKIWARGEGFSNTPGVGDVSWNGSFILSCPLVPDSINHLSFVCRDASGNKSQPVQISVTQDSTAPQVVSVLPDGTRSVRYDTSIMVTFSEEVLPETINSRFFLHDPESRSLEGAVVVSQDGKIATFHPSSPLQQEKTYTIMVAKGVSDTLGNVTSAAFTSTFTTMQDTTFPKEPVITSIIPPSPTNQSMAAITGTTTPYCHIEVTGGSQVIQAEANDKGEFSLPEIPLQENQTNTLLISARNPVNNLTGSTSLQIVHDNTPPLVTISAPPGGVTLSKKVVTLIGRVEDVSGVEKVRIINGEKNVEVKTQNGTFLGAIELIEGQNTVTVSAVDRLGQEGSASLQITRLIEAEGVDTTTPIVTITYPRDGATVFQEKVYVEGTVEDNDPAIMGQVSVNGKPIDSWVVNVFGVLVDLDGEINPITVTATDSAGNIGTRTITVKADLEEVPPPVLSELPSFTDLLMINLSGTTQPSLTILIQGGKSEIQVQADQQGAFLAVVTLHPNQTNHLKVYALAQSGKKSQPAQVTIAQDSEEPKIASLTPQDGETLVDPKADIVA
ncbi:MAG: Ig-like domain-containing protein, partial [bacterium]